MGLIQQCSGTISLSASSDSWKCSGYQLQCWDLSSVSFCLYARQKSDLLYYLSGTYFMLFHYYLQNFRFPCHWLPSCPSLLQIYTYLPISQIYFGFSLLPNKVTLLWMTHLSTHYQNLFPIFYFLPPSIFNGTHLGTIVLFLEGKPSFIFFFLNLSLPFEQVKLGV